APGWNSVQAVNKFQSEVGGPLRGGDPGKRLIEPGDAELPYFRDVPNVFKERKDGVLIVPLYHIFGSEELSVLSPGIAERAPKLYLALNPEDAGRFQLREGQDAEVVISKSILHLPVVIMGSLPPGIAGMPAGLKGVEGIALPEWGAMGQAP
ncbi:MAG TPA: hypothetical protein VED67_04760, partial [Thermodesulfovibrionales bacterium]|nr:hypothetical protein [Thermodesulfovibrionales bacterium]